MANALKMKPQTNSGTYSMTNYEVRRHGNKWKVFEESTQQYIYQANSKWQAVKVQNKLQNGSGFVGHTPSFFKV